MQFLSKFLFLLYITNCIFDCNIHGGFTLPKFSKKRLAISAALLISGFLTRIMHKKYKLHAAKTDIMDNAQVIKDVFSFLVNRSPKNKEEVYKNSFFSQLDLSWLQDQNLENVVALAQRVTESNCSPNSIKDYIEQCHLRLYSYVNALRAVRDMEKERKNIKEDAFLQDMWQHRLKELYEQIRWDKNTSESFIQTCTDFINRWDSHADLFSNILSLPRQVEIIKFCSKFVKDFLDAFSTTDTYTVYRLCFGVGVQILLYECLFREQFQTTIGQMYECSKSYFSVYETCTKYFTTIFCQKYAGFINSNKTLRENKEKFDKKKTRQKRFGNLDVTDLTVIRARNEGQKELNVVLRNYVLNLKNSIKDKIEDEEDIKFLNSFGKFLDKYNNMIEHWMRLYSIITYHKLLWGDDNIAINMFQKKKVQIDNGLLNAWYNSVLENIEKLLHDNLNEIKEMSFFDITWLQTFNNTVIDNISKQLVSQKREKFTIQWEEQKKNNEEVLKKFQQSFETVDKDSCLVCYEEDIEKLLLLKDHEKQEKQYICSICFPSIQYSACPICRGLMILDEEIKSIDCDRSKTPSKTSVIEPSSYDPRAPLQ